MDIITNFTWIEQVILIIGCLMGCIAAVDTNFEDAKAMMPLTYNSYGNQVVNRYLFVIGVLLCLLACLTAAETPLITLIGCFFGLCLVWFLTFFLLRCVVSVIRWCHKKQ